MPDQVTSNRLAVNQPTRGVDHNRSLADRADPATDEMLLPSLDGGITLLDVEGGRVVSILQSLVLDRLLLHDGPAFWIDAHGHATTTTLARIAPTRRLLDRIHVARGFTAYQHYGAVCDLPTAMNGAVQDLTADDSPRQRQPAEGDSESRCTPSLVVAPAVDVQYRTADTLGERHAETLLARALARFAAYADGYDVPVLVTRSTQNDCTAPVAAAADHHLKCEQTRMGPRILGEDFETLVYPVDDGAYYQTTFAYWRHLLEARARQVGVEPASDAVSTSTPEGVGTGVTADGEAVTAAADPLLDAWTTSGTGGR